MLIIIYTLINIIMQTISHRNRYTPIPGIKHPISKKTEFIYIYNSKLNKLKSKQNELENISGNFYKDYSKTKSNFFYVDPFIEIKTKYREMGYERECNLTRQSSLFKPTPLLLHNDAINLFYKNKVLLNFNNNNNTSSTTTVHSHSPQMQIDGGKPAMYLQKLQKEITRVNTQPKKLRVLKLFQQHLFNNNNNTLNPSLSNNVILQLRSNVFNNSLNTTTKTKSTDRVIKHKHIIQENKQLKEYNNKLQSTMPSHEIDENFTSRIRRDTVRKIAFEHAVKQFGNLIDDDESDNNDNKSANASANNNNNSQRRQTINVIYKRDHKKKKNTIVFRKDNNIPSSCSSSYRKNNFKFKTLMTNNFAKTKNDEKTHNRLIHLVNRMKDNKVSFAEFHNKVEQLPINKETIGDWINKSYKVNKTETEKTKLNKVLTSTHPNTLVQLVYQSKTKANAYDIENSSPLKVKGVLLRKMKDVNTTINQIDKDVMSKIINSIHQE